MSEAQKNYVRKTAYDKIREEDAQRRGTGFITVLSDLDWYLSLELDEERPLDERKITTNQRLFQILKGVEFGMMMHAGVLMGLSLSVGLLLWSMKVVNPIIINLAWFYVLFMSLAVKIGISYWLVDRYYIFPKGITYTYLSNFLGGYSVGLFIPEFFMFLFSSVLSFMFFILKEKHITNKFILFIHKYLPHFTDIKFIPINFISLILCFAPIFVLRFRRKKSTLEAKFMPLDYIPED